MVRLVALIWMFCASALWAEVPILSAPEAQSRLNAGDLIVLDIRRPAEWKETGVAKGAWPVSMHRSDFGQQLQLILAEYQPDQIALICATGVRTARVTQQLEKYGLTGIHDLSEGMLGNPRGPGWIARGLDIVSAEDAMRLYEAERQGW